MMSYFRNANLMRNLMAVAWLVLWAPSLMGQTLQRPGVIDLSGTWELFVGTEEPANDQWEQIDLPASGLILGVSSAKESLWMRREITIGADWASQLAPGGLAVLISSSLYGNYDIFAGDELIGTWKGPLPGISEPPPRVYPIAASATERDRLVLTIVWQWEGWAHSRVPQRDSLLGEDWLVGDQRLLATEAELRRFEDLNDDLPLLILVLLFTAIGLYHLQLFRRDPRCREYLWFGLTALIVAFDTMLFTHWVSGVTVHYVVVRRMYDLMGALMVAGSIQFLWPLLSHPIGRWLRAYQVSLVVLGCLVAVVPEGSLAPMVEAVSKAWSLPFLPAMVILVVKEVRRGNPEARTVSFGVLSVVILGGSEMVSQLLGRGTTFPLPAVAFTLFALSMAFSLSNRFSRVHDDLDGLRRQLEDMVEDRASELSTANERLQSQIAERELAQEAMRMLERAVEQSVDGILVSDLDGMTLFANEAWARMHGQEAFEVFGSCIDRFHSPEQMETEVRPALAAVRKEGFWEGHVHRLRKDGSAFPTWMSITLLRDPEGDPVGFAAVARDVTERLRAMDEQRQMESRLQESEKLRSLAELAGGIAHDYNNLLTGVLGNASLAQAALPPRSGAGEKLIQIGTAAERAADLTDQLLTYAGAATPITSRVELNDLVQDLRSELSRVVSREAQGSEVELETLLSHELAEVEIDAAQVRQALLSLIHNAADSVTAAGGGLVTLETGRATVDSSYFAGAYPSTDLPSGDYAFLRVSDTGEGIDPASRGRIFDPFFSTKASSRGLGLATVLSTARAHSGTIKVASKYGEGAVFELLFPFTNAIAQEVRKPDTGLGGWRASGSILVVDDEQIMREVSRSILEQLGFEVFTASDGKEALELYHQHHDEIRLVLLDLTMPAMSGMEVLSEILAFCPTAQVVMMSGYAKDTAVQELTAKGMVDFLPKPFRPDQLLSKVRNVLEPGA